MEAMRLTDEDTLALADAGVPMTAYLILERAFCECEASCTCGWDD